MSNQVFHVAIHVIHVIIYIIHWPSNVSQEIFCKKLVGSKSVFKAFGRCRPTAKTVKPKQNMIYEETVSSRMMFIQTCDKHSLTHMSST
jgi:hypothetical protein